MVDRPDRKSYIIEKYANQEDALEIGIAWLQDSLEPNEVGVIAVGGLDNLSMLVGKVVGHEAAKALKKGATIRLGNDRFAEVMTLKKKPREWRDRVVLVCFPGQKLLDEVDKPSARVKAVCVVAWHPEGVEQWKRTWNPKTITQH